MAVNFAPSFLLHKTPAHAKDIQAYHQDRWNALGYTSYKQALQSDTIGVMETDGTFWHPTGDHEVCTMTTIFEHFEAIRKFYAGNMNEFAIDHADADHKKSVADAKAHVANWLNTTIAVDKKTGMDTEYIQFTQQNALRGSDGTRDGSSVMSGDTLRFGLQLGNLAAIMPDLEKSLGHKTAVGLSKDDISKLASYYDVNYEGARGGNHYTEFFAVSKSNGGTLDAVEDLGVVQETIYFAKVLTEIDKRVADYNAWQKDDKKDFDSFFNYFSKSDKKADTITRQDIFAALDAKITKQFFVSDQWSVANMEVYIDKRGDCMAVNV